MRLHERELLATAMFVDLIRSIYISTRRRIRRVVIRNRWLDVHIGKSLVAIDLALRKLGILEKILETGVISHNGLTIHYRRQDAALASSLLTNHDYEPETRMTIENSLTPGATFVDLGAHIGYFTLIAARKVGPDGQVFAFEPTPGTRAVLQQNISANNFDDRVVVEPLAISRTRGSAEFLEFEASEFNSLAVTSEEQATQTISVDVVSLDDYFRSRNWPKIDLIKMDIEGQEFHAVCGMQQLGLRNPNMKLIFEYHLAQLERSRTNRAELFEALKSLGFHRFTVLFREPFSLNLPAQLAELEETAKRANVNIMAERSAKS